jgi:hypothetical protein
MPTHRFPLDKELSTMVNCTLSDQVNATLEKSDVGTNLQLQAEIDQLLAQIETYKFALEQSNADRDFYQEQVTRVTWLEEQNETLIANNKYLANEREWMRGVLYNPTIDAIKKVALMSSYDECKSGEWAHVVIWQKAGNIGVYRDTYGGALIQLAEQGIIDRDEKHPKKTGDKDGDGKEKRSQDILVRFSEALLKYPRDIKFEKEDKRKNNGKGGGKNAKPKQCPECSSVQVDELDVCKCRSCNHEWVDGPPKDANRNAPMTPWDYGQVEEDAAELVQESTAAYTPPPADDNDEDRTLDYDSACELINELCEHYASIEWLPDGKRLLHAPPSTKWLQDEWRKRIVLLDKELRDIYGVAHG